MSKSIAALFLAYWLGTGATITLPTPGCLWVKHRDQAPVLYHCYDKAGVVVIGKDGPVDAAYRPTQGDEYILVEHGVLVGRAPLVGRPVLMPVILR